IAAIAKSAGLGIYGGCMFETGIAHAAGALMNAVIPDHELGCEFYMSNYYLREDILTEPFKIENGMFCIPEGPGLGIDIDRSKLEKYSIALVSEF
ncbi:MAG: enolase C-terminal domain-like protein, partial [Desulfobulbia bacterium]